VKDIDQSSAAPGFARAARRPRSRAPQGSRTAVGPEGATERAGNGTQVRLIDIGRPSRAFPVTPPCVRVRTRRFGRVKQRVKSPILEGCVSQRICWARPAELRHDVPFAKSYGERQPQPLIESAEHRAAVTPRTGSAHSSIAARSPCEDVFESMHPSSGLLSESGRNRNTHANHEGRRPAVRSSGPD